MRDENEQPNTPATAAMKIAVVLFNLGGPDSQAAVRPFLRNLFSDPAIIAAPWPIRPLLAWLISTLRAKKARRIYQAIGGASPINRNTEDQRNDLQEKLTGKLGNNYRVFVGMRYWHPFIERCVQAVREFRPDRVILLPLYPQFSTTTTESSLREWQRVYSASGADARTATSVVGYCCYPVNAGFVSGYAELIAEALAARTAAPLPRLLFSAHGLPKKIVDGGDPYQWQIEQTAAAIVAKLAVTGLDWVVCYQSRVGPLQWIGPSTADEIRRAGADGVGVMVVPIAFVSEHAETLVELDIDYRELAAGAGVDDYTRIATVGRSTAFINGLAELVVAAADAASDAASDAVGLRPISDGGGRVCPAAFKRCPCVVEADQGDRRRQPELAS